MIRKRYLCVFIVCALLTASASAQVQADKIELSETTTVIEDTGLAPEKAAIPDFSLILPADTDGLPVIADSGISAEAFIPPEEPVSEEAGQQVFLEGAVGTGWPGFFSGDFSVYRNIGAEPFNLEFYHETVSSVGKHAVAEGFESQETRLSGEKRFMLSDTLVLDTSAGYGMKSDGLQGKNPNYWSISRQDVNGSVQFRWAPMNHLVMTGFAEGMFNTQYASGTQSATYNMAGLLSAVELSWAADKWNAKLNSQYDIGTMQNRFSIGADLSLDVLSYVDAAVSVSSVLANNSSMPVLVPFSVSLSTGSKLPFSGSISGGLKTYSADLLALQKKTPFLFSGIVPSETTEWYGKADAAIPVTSLGYINLGADFAMTAYGGKRLLPDYSKLDSTTGLIATRKSDVFILDTSVGMTVPLQVVNISLGWNSSWLDSTDYEKTRDSSSALTASLSAATGNGKWGGGADLFWAFSKTPEIGLNGYYQMTRSVKLEIEVSDIVALLTAEDRLMAQTYAGRGGFAAMYMKVNF